MKRASSKDLHHLFGTYPDADTTKAMKAFHLAARKVAGMIAKAAHGEYDSREAEQKVYKAVNNLDDRANKPEIRGDDNAREKAWAEAAHLRASVRPALDEGMRVRHESRGEEIDRHELEKRMAWNKLSSYEKELRLMRSGRDPNSHRGWRIEPTEATQMHYATATGKQGKGRKTSGYSIYYPEGGTKTVPTLKAAKAYIDEYLGNARDPDYKGHSYGVFVFADLNGQHPERGFVVRTMGSLFAPYHTMTPIRVYKRYTDADKYADKLTLAAGRDPAFQKKSRAWFTRDKKSKQNIVHRFFFVLVSKLSQYDEKQSRTRHWNPHALGIYMIRVQEMRAELGDTDNLAAFRDCLVRSFDPKMPPVANVLKQLTAYMLNGKLPKIT